MRARIATTLTLLGVLLLLVWAGSLAHRSIVGGWQRSAVLARIGGAGGAYVPAPDTSDWAPARVSAFLASLAGGGDAEPLAVLEIPSVGLSVLVLDGIDEWALNRGVGWIPGTAPPGTAGNVGIAGHRDGFFRALRAIAPGEIVEWRGPQGSRRYRVAWTRVVAPEEVDVLGPTEHDALTLVTCHPFYFMGPAPNRFIVRAEAIDAGGHPLALGSR